MKSTSIEVKTLNSDTNDVKATMRGCGKPKLSDFILCFAEMISKYGDSYVDINTIKFVEEND